MLHILLPTDFSDRSLNACTFAQDLFGDGGHRHTLLHAYLDPLPGHSTLVQMSSSAYAAGVEGMAAFVQQLRDLEGGSRPAPSTEVVFGTLVSAIDQVCRHSAIDLVVMGTRGTGSTSLFGSNAAAVVKASRAPVLVVPEHARYHGLRRILLADDHKEVDRHAMERLARLALQHHAEVIIAHVLRKENEDPDPKVIAAYDDVFAAVPHRYIDARGGDVALVLDVMAQSEGVDLVAVLHRHTGLLHSLFHASVSKGLVLHTQVPLLVYEGQ